MNSAGVNLLQRAAIGLSDRILRDYLTFRPSLPQCPALIQRSTGMYAIIEDSGTQFKVTSGDRIRIDRKVKDDEKNVTFDRVLLVAGEGSPKLGLPLIGGVTVTAEVLRAVKGPKIDIQKYKRRKGYHRKIGHRQQYTEVKITAINV
jgi:large subunit ribosomal protein L21